MPRLEQTIDAVFSDRDITPSDVPQLDLYMDQVLTLFDRTLSESKRAPGDKLLTKTMVNNYVKEGLMTPVRGKKYTRQQMHAAAVRVSSKADAASERRQGTDGPGRMWISKPVMLRCSRTRNKCATFIPELLRSQLTNDASDPNDRLRLCLALSEVANYLRRLCESMIDAIPSEEKGD